MWNLIRGFGRARDGATAVEYALIASLIALVVAAGIGTLGAGLVPLFQAVLGSFPGA